jgi:hypothetical protein
VGVAWGHRLWSNIKGNGKFLAGKQPPLPFSQSVPPKRRHCAGQAREKGQEGWPVDTTIAGRRHGGLDSEGQDTVSKTMGGNRWG